MMKDINLYKALLLINESYELTKESEYLHDDIKVIILELITYFVDLNININDVINNSEVLVLDEEMEKLINEVKDIDKIDNIEQEKLNLMIKDYNKRFANKNNCNNINKISDLTAKEVDKLVEEFSLELGD